MPPPFAVGCYLPQHVPPTVLVAWARAAERAGLRAVWLPDHVHHFPDTREDRLEAWTLLSALAVETSVIRLGLGVCNVQFRNPALVAKMAFTVDHLSHGRFDLALGTGGNAAEMRAYGIVPRAGSAARQRLTDAILTLRALESGGPANTPPGSTALLRDAYCAPAPVQRPFPLAVAGDHGETLRIVARHADCWFANLYTPERFAEQCNRLTAIITEEGREPDAVARRAHVLAIVGCTPEEAQRAAAAYRSVPHARLFEQAHMVGDATLLSEGLAAYRRAGATEAAVYVLNLPEGTEREGAGLIQVLADAAALVNEENPVA